MSTVSSKSFNFITFKKIQKTKTRREISSPPHPPAAAQELKFAQDVSAHEAKAKFPIPGEFQKSHRGFVLLSRDKRGDKHLPMPIIIIIMKIE